MSLFFAAGSPTTEMSQEEVRSNLFLALARKSSPSPPISPACTPNPSSVPAILYRINPETGAATKIVNLVGSNTVMGLGFARDGKLYATDFTGFSGLYVIDPETGFESAVAAMPFGFSTGLVLADPLP